MTEASARTYADLRTAAAQAGLAADFVECIPVSDVAYARCAPYRMDAAGTLNGAADFDVSMIDIEAAGGDRYRLRRVEFRKRGASMTATGLPGEHTWRPGDRVPADAPGTDFATRCLVQRRILDRLRDLAEDDAVHAAVRDFILEPPSLRPDEIESLVRFAGLNLNASRTYGDGLSAADIADALRGRRDLTQIQISRLLGIAALAQFERLYEVHRGQSEVPVFVFESDDALLLAAPNFAAARIWNATSVLAGVAVGVDRRILVRYANAEDVRSQASKFGELLT